jgi:hypothetical protein
MTLQLVEETPAAPIVMPQPANEFISDSFGLPCMIDWWKQVPWKRQIGPSCGLAAVRMVRDSIADATSACQPPLSLLQMAKDLGYTAFGEILSAVSLAQLTEKYFSALNLGAQVTVRDVSTLADFAASSRHIAIVPYDRDCASERPAFSRGLNVHWGVVVGGFHVEAKDPSHGVIVQHGASDKLGIALLSDFVASNLQLYSVLFNSDGVHFDECDLGGLRGSYVLVCSYVCVSKQLLMEVCSLLYPAILLQT